ncbi:MAG: hypothetical protein JO127_04815 [Caulobacteraceae bacterium]|nr:hypothetical protein [Caulobacteraceae bacterium]
MTAGMPRLGGTRRFAFAALEARYMELRAAGRSAAEAGRTLRLTAGAQARFEEWRRAEGAGPEDGLPAFARHEEHVEAALAAGGFPRGTPGAGWIGPDAKPWRPGVRPGEGAP